MAITQWDWGWDLRRVWSTTEIPPYRSLPGKRKAAAPSQGVAKAPCKYLLAPLRLSNDRWDRCSQTASQSFRVTTHRSGSCVGVCLLNLIYKITRSIGAVSLITPAPVQICCGKMSAAWLWIIARLLFCVFCIQRVLLSPGQSRLVAAYASLTKTKPFCDILCMHSFAYVISAVHSLGPFFNDVCRCSHDGERPFSARQPQPPIAHPLSPPSPSSPPASSQPWQSEDGLWRWLPFSLTLSSAPQNAFQGPPE